LTAIRAVIGRGPKLYLDGRTIGADRRFHKRKGYSCPQRQKLLQLNGSLIAFFMPW